MTSYDLLGEYQNHIVPQSYNAGFVALSYVVSMVGAGSSLELINRRTGFRGLFNHLLLVSSAVTMGGVAIWCMHFIGNRAIDLANGEPEMQIAYSRGFTAASFFIPILVLLAAFLAIGTNNTVSWWRVIIGGVLCGVATCSMHYLGNASIKNYTCVYRPVNIVGSAIIAVVASNVALFTFFVFRAVWTNSWQKRAISAAVLASAVSGMHWCAATGTRYRLRDIKSEGNEPSKGATVIVVICLSLGACFIIATSAIIRARNMKKSALRAQQVTLGAAVFDKGGRILIDPDGFIPSTVVTDSFLEKNTKDGFSISHPIFQWMFQASRNWSTISNFVGGMRRHISQLPHSSTHKDGRRGIQLISEYGEIIERYDVIFKELFCLAAAELADRFHEDMTSVGVLWDEIIPTGPGGKWPRAQSRMGSRLSLSWGTGDAHEDNQSGSDMAEKGLNARQQDFGRGLLMLLIRRIESDRDAERFVSAGYRFAELHQVSNIIRSCMQIQSSDFETKLRSMSTYTTKHNEAPPGVHIGFFSIRACVSSGFEVLVQKDARHLLPSTALPLKTLENWHVQFLRRFENMPVSKILQSLKEEISARQNAQEIEFAGQLSETIKTLCEWTQEPLFEDAVLTSTMVRVPCRDDEEWVQSTMIVMRRVIPIHSVLSSPNCEFVPLSFFKMRQFSAQFQQEFIRGVHQEFGHVVKLADRREGSPDSEPGFLSKFWPFGRSDSLVATRMNSKTMAAVRGRRALSPNSRQARPPCVDIMMFQDITADVEERKPRAEQGPGSEDSDTLTIAPTNSKTSPVAGIELQSMGHFGTNLQADLRVSNDIGMRKSSVNHTLPFVDILFVETIESREKKTAREASG
ncbi:hypothetical protein NW754_001544 [Fusarium falciforme]|uniref:MHYT domain-containing protein n=1 Tax=Fusarium falciforme TaxID=195108 RepID=UPI00230173AB|nr:MHYT domain-containing protein [Fusarium falciforme]KAJ4169213.1 hypothetical protein NW754_001544 [Fusarium falciforme]WAO97122.1 MHYT domain-containing protein [Fusarium falciforme]